MLRIAGRGYTQVYDDYSSLDTRYSVVEYEVDAKPWVVLDTWLSFMAPCAELETAVWLAALLQAHVVDYKRLIWYSE